MKRTHTLGFDAKYANAETNGIGNYCRFVARAIATAYPENTYLRLYTPTQLPNADYEALAEMPNVESMEPDGQLWRRLKRLWRMWHVSIDAKRGDVELFHGLCNTLPYGLARRGIRSVVTIHDLRFIRYPNHFNIIDRILREFMMRSACRRADRIIAASETTKRDLRKLLRVNPEKIDVVYQGCDPRYSEDISDEQVTELREKYQLPEHYLLNVGEVEERKNIGLIIEALAELPNSFELVVASKQTSYTKRLKRRAKSLGVERRVHFRNIAEEDKPALYKGADIFIYPSHFEGFAVEILEALSVGVPVVATRGSSLEEAGGDKTIYVSPRDCGEMVKAIERITADEELRDVMISAGKRHTRHFRSEVTAYGIMKCYERIGIELEIE